MDTDDAQQRLETAEELTVTNPQGAAAALLALIVSATEETAKIAEKAVGLAGRLFVKTQSVAQLRELLESLKPMFSFLPKAKTAKIVRNVLDFIGEIPGSESLQMEACKEWVEWCKVEKRTFLRQRIELRLATLYLGAHMYQEALQLVSTLVHEVKRLDDKALLVEIFLLESYVHHALRNIARSRASLTSARTHANAIYCPPLLQGALDMQSGVLSAEERDYKTSYSYFYEAFEGYSTLNNDEKALPCLKLMLLCKIMTNNAEDVTAVTSGKLALRYAGPDLDAMRAVAQAHSNRSLDEFERVLVKFSKELSQDPLIKTHLSELNDSLLEQNLLKIVEPFSRVELDYVADKIKLPRQRVESKLSQMILDKLLDGTLDQGAGSLSVFDAEQKDALYPTATETVHQLGKVVDGLFEKCKRL